MTNVIPFPHVNGAEASGRVTLSHSLPELRAKAWSNYYSAERRDGVSPELAHQRADYFVVRRFDELLEEIRSTMGRG